MRLSISWKAFVFPNASAAAQADQGLDALTPDMVFAMLRRDLLETHGVTPAQDHAPFAGQVVRHTLQHAVLHSVGHLERLCRD